MSKVDNNPYSAPSEELEDPASAPMTHAEIKRKVRRESLLILVIVIALFVLGFIL